MVGKRVKQMRIQRGMSQEELAKAIGYKGRDSVCRIESGETAVKGKTLIALAQALDCSTRYLLGEIDKPYYYGANILTEDEIENIDNSQMSLQLLSYIHDSDSVKAITELARRLSEDKRRVVISVMENMV